MSVNLADLKTWVEIVQAIVTTLAIVIGGAWALWRFRLHREGYANLEFDVGVNVLGLCGDSILVELTANVENKGRVRHWVQDFTFDLHYLPSGGPAVEGDKRINQQTLFSALISRRDWIPPDWKKEFLDPGVRQQYRYTTTVPRNAKYLLLYSQIEYADKGLYLWRDKASLTLENTIPRAEPKRRPNNPWEFQVAQKTIRIQDEVTNGRAEPDIVSSSAWWRQYLRVILRRDSEAEDKW